MRMKYTLRLLAHVNHWNYYSIQEKNSSNIPFVCIPHLSLNIIIETISLARSLARFSLQTEECHRRRFN